MSTHRSVLPPLKSFWKQALFLGGLTIFTAYTVKSKVTIRRKQQYIKETSSYDDASHLKKKVGEDGEIERKSEFEGAGNSYMSRKHGDKFNYWMK